MSEQLTKVGRLAFRHEGQNWNAYYALPDTMNGAIYLGSIRITAVADPKIKQSFIALMRDVVSGILEKETGEKTHWNEPVLAPEHEKAGNA